MTEIILPILGILIALLVVIWLYILLPYNMAKKRGRSTLGWIILFWLITPIWGIIFLLIVGNSEKKIRKEIIKELRHN
ncbi:MAG: hypothetical protein J6Q71_03880 [Bacteroidales bacterium]|nr:hypothetical protein [Bacteroidales bacterium]